MPSALNLTGQRFGRLTVATSTTNRIAGKVLWRCLCDCRIETFATTGHLRSGQRVSCGCAKLSGNQIKKRTPKHGHYVGDKPTATYRIWSGMLQRCKNPKTRCFGRYGARGIKVCKRWLKFENFLADMGERPAGKSIDRIDNDGNYEPSNCRWATDREQHRNRSDNVRLTFNGTTRSLVEWEECLGLPRGILKDRLRSGWTTEKALTCPIMTKSQAAIYGDKVRRG